MVSPAAIVDLLTTVPTFIEVRGADLVCSIDPISGPLALQYGIDVSSARLSFLRFLRILRIARCEMVFVVPCAVVMSFGA